MPHSIKEVNRRYFQRSMFFLYPGLRVPPHVQFKPVSTYLSWENKYDVSDRRLICLFPETQSELQKIHEKKHLLNNSRFEDFIELSDDKCIYVFNFDNLSKDWDCVVHGKYSKMSTHMKICIGDFFRADPKSLGYMDSYLNPASYYDQYAKILDVEQDILKEGVELLSLPDLGKEHLLNEHINFEVSLNLE